jgi:predicted transcriptional regulator
MTRTEQRVYAAIPTLPRVTTAADLAERLPDLSRSTIDRALRHLRSTCVFVLHGTQGRVYGAYPPESLL